MTQINKLWLMEVFVRVADCGSFTKAADALDVSNGTVTNSIRQLEQHLGVILFNRDTRRVFLTEEGKVYLTHCRPILEETEDAEEVLRSRTSGLSGSVHLEAPISVGQSLVCPALRTFARMYPNISTAVTLTNRPRHVFENRIDLAVRMHHVEDADLVARKIYDSHYIICTTPAAARQLPAHPRELDPARCVGLLLEERTQARPWSLEDGDEQLVIEPRWPVKFNSTDAILQVLEDTEGEAAPIAYVLEVFARRQLASGSLVQVYPQWTTGSRPIYLVFPKARVSSAKVRALADFITELFVSGRHSGGDADAVAVKPMGRR